MERVREYCLETWSNLSRKRRLIDVKTSTPLKRCLSTMDITLLGVGHMVGAGIYVLTGSVTRDIAGPGIIVSFIIAAVVSLLSATCFAEFAARMPQAGSTYVYTYIIIGEFWAFIVGWNMILDMLVGMAAVARAYSGYINGLTGEYMSNWTSPSSPPPTATEHALWTQHLDFLAAGVVIVFSMLQIVGVRTSTNINSFFSMVNICVMVFVGIYGLSFADLSNWSDFLPYGFSGVMAGSASCFFAFIGLDSISISSEEAKDPEYSVPRATFYALTIVTIGYILLTIALTLMVPYYKINVTNALPGAFQYHNVGWARYLVSAAALAGMSSVIYGHVYAAPRYAYAMASDGLLCSLLARVSTKTQVPVLSTILTGLGSATMALCLDISQLVEFLSMGTLIGYSMVAMAVLFLRYRPTLTLPDGTVVRECIGGELRTSCGFLQPLVSRLPYGAVPDTCVVVFAITSLLIGACAAQLSTHAQPTLMTIVALSALSIVVVISVLTMLAFEETVPLTFAVPMCPFVPLVSIAFNSVLLSNLRPGTWLRFSIWMLIGIVTYLTYGMRHSKAESLYKRQEMDTVSVTAADDTQATSTQLTPTRWYNSTDSVDSKSPLARDERENQDPVSSK